MESLYLLLKRQDEDKILLRRLQKDLDRLIYLEKDVLYKVVADVETDIKATESRLDYLDRQIKAQILEIIKGE